MDIEALCPGHLDKQSLSPRQGFLGPGYLGTFWALDIYLCLCPVPDLTVLCLCYCERVAGKEVRVPDLVDGTDAEAVGVAGHQAAHCVAVLLGVAAGTPGTALLVHLLNLDFFEYNYYSLILNTFWIFYFWYLELKKNYKNNIFHRDLKAENILLINPGDIYNIKIIDFGISCHFSSNKLKE